MPQRRAGQGQGQARPRHPRRLAQGRRERRGHRPGRPRQEQLIKAITLHRPRPADAAQGREADRRGDRRPDRLGEDGRARPARRPAGGAKLTGLDRQGPRALGVPALKNPPVPTVQNTAWVKTPVDAFILAKLEQNEMKPSPPAAKETLIRRATYDLIGLPPTPEEVEAFVNDSRRTRSRRSSTACSPPRTTASAGAASGSTSPATATPAAARRTTARTTTATPTPGRTATTSSRRSTTTSRTTSS